MTDTNTGREIYVPDEELEGFASFCLDASRQLAAGGKHAPPYFLIVAAADSDHRRIFPMTLTPDELAQRPDMFYECGRIFSGHPLAVLLALEVWVADPEDKGYDDQLPPSRQANRQEAVIIAGITADHRRRAWVFRIGRDTTGAAIVSHASNEPEYGTPSFALLDLFWRGHYTRYARSLHWINSKGALTKSGRRAKDEPDGWWEQRGVPRGVIDGVRQLLNEVATAA